MAFNLNPSRFPKITTISQRKIDLDENWWKERITFYGIYLWGPWTLYYDSFQTTLDGYWWRHHQLQFGPLVIEWRTRGKKMLTHL